MNHYNGKSYKQTLSVEKLKQTQEFDPLEDSIDIKAIANAALKKANEFSPDKTFSITGVKLSRRHTAWYYVTVSLREPITPESQIITSEIIFIFSVSGVSAEVVEE